MKHRIAESSMTTMDSFDRRRPRLHFDCHRRGQGRSNCSAVMWRRDDGDLRSSGRLSIEKALTIQAAAETKRQRIVWLRVGRTTEAIRILKIEMRFQRVFGSMQSQATAL